MHSSPAAEDCEVNRSFALHPKATISERSCSYFSVFLLVKLDHRKRKAQKDIVELLLPCQSIFEQEGVFLFHLVGQKQKSKKDFGSLPDKTEKILFRTLHKVAKQKAPTAVCFHSSLSKR